MYATVILPTNGFLYTYSEGDTVEVELFLGRAPVCSVLSRHILWSNLSTEKIVIVRLAGLL